MNANLLRTRNRGKTLMLDAEELSAFAGTMDVTREGKALHSRGEFLQAFPLQSLQNLTLPTYAIGNGAASFCNFVEARTNDWAHIKGSTAFKFGVYYGITSTSKIKQYRFTRKFGGTAQAAFVNVKKALLELVEAGQNDDFERIDANPLSQLFKAKILSLYFPEKYLNVCSKEHLQIIGEELEMPQDCPSSEYQSRILEVKKANRITQAWSNPKFMEFLYAKFIWNTLNELLEPAIRKPRTKSKRNVDFEELTAKWREIGVISENYALDWERKRLSGVYPKLADRIQDVRTQPTHGYDFLSFEHPDERRFIEVKSAGYDFRTKSYRFFLSTNEYEVSQSAAHRDHYYFYVVFFGKGLVPKDIKLYRAMPFYASCALEAGAYIARFQTVDGGTLA